MHRSAWSLQRSATAGAMQLPRSELQPPSAWTCGPRWLGHETSTCSCCCVLPMGEYWTSRLPAASKRSSTLPGYSAACAESALQNIARNGSHAIRLSSAEPQMNQWTLLHSCNSYDPSFDGTDVIFGSQQDLQSPYPCRY
jgi:hypothetical protein